MAREINIKKGLDIPLEGKAEGKPESIKSGLVGICPGDFPGYTWKCDVKPGDVVAKGSPLFHAKEAETIKLVSPVAGTVEEIRRGERRRILAVTVKPDNDVNCQIQAGSISEKLKLSGLWAMMRQRPFDVVPDENAQPRDIFVTAFDSSPLAGNVIPTHIAEYLEPGLEALKTLTKGTVYLAVRPGQGLRTKVAKVLDMIGPHPAGNASVQIAAVAPINKGETVWTVDAGTVARLGMLVKKGYCDYRAEVAITGPAAIKPKKVLTEIG
ncbi:MAG: NADH:ubiquinone reductase (Na(+)-transporting) subunit A, partial [Muribaculaceae bacterium]|nr:NADH:ubiquinone reductase (Na(+)-transporting) subunit A [Muribaculaceae bacterium]